MGRRHRGRPGALPVRLRTRSHLTWPGLLRSCPPGPQPRQTAFTHRATKARQAARPHQAPGLRQTAFTHQAARPHRATGVRGSLPGQGGGGLGLGNALGGRDIDQDLLGRGVVALTQVDRTRPHQPVHPVPAVPAQGHRDHRTQDRQPQGHEQGLPGERGPQARGRLRPRPYHRGPGRQGPGGAPRHRPDQGEHRQRLHRGHGRQHLGVQQRPAHQSRRQQHQGVHQQGQEP